MKSYKPDELFDKSGRLKPELADLAPKGERRMSFDELRALVSRLQQAMRAAGIGVGDRVAAMLPNLPETIAFTLAAASLGATWSSCSPDFGERGVLDRFGQIDPKLFVACDGYRYNGKAVEVAGKLPAIAAALPSAAKVVIVPYLGRAEAVAAAVPRASTRCSREGSTCRRGLPMRSGIVRASCTRWLRCCIARSATASCRRS